MKIYISGKISGIENIAPQLFEKAELFLRSKGWDVVNPMTIKHDHDKSWISYMKEDIKAMCDCDAVYMLNNWKDSNGAKIEHSLANALGMHIEYES